MKLWGLKEAQLHRPPPAAEPAAADAGLTLLLFCSR